MASPLWALLLGLSVGSYKRETLTLQLQDQVRSFQPKLHEYLHDVGFNGVAPTGPLVDVWSQSVNGRNFLIRRMIGADDATSMCYGVYQAFDGNVTITTARMCTNILQIM